MAGAVVDCKDTEEEDGVKCVFSEVGVQPQLCAELCPYDPVPVGGKGSRRNDSGAGHCCCSMEVSAEFVALERWQSFQPPTCG